MKIAVFSDNIIRRKLTDRFAYSLHYLQSRVFCVDYGTSAEIVYESRGKLIGGSLSRERTVEKSTIRNEGGDIYWWQRWDTRSNKKETDGIHDGGIRDPTRKRLTGYKVDTRSNKKETDGIHGGYDIQRVRDLFRDSADYKRQRANISLCNKRLVWRCGGEDKETLANAKKLYSS